MLRLRGEKHGFSLIELTFESIPFLCLLDREKAREYMFRILKEFLDWKIFFQWVELLCSGISLPFETLERPSDFQVG